MSETPDTTVPPAGPPPPAEPKPYWLYRLAAWVAIIAGIVFIVSSIFMAGVWAGKGGPRGHHCHHGHHGHHAMLHQGPHHGPGPLTPPPGPQRPGPGEPPPSVSGAPAPTPPR